MIGFDGERAVSDVLAFIFVFSIIITSVALVYGTGFSALETTREGEQKANAERAFEAVALSMDDIVSGEAPRRGGSLELGGARLEVDDETAVTVRVEDESDDQVFSDTRTVGSFEYFLDDTQVAYENGGVFRSDSGNSVNVQRSSMTCTDERAVVSVVVLESSSGALGSDGGVELTMEDEETSLLYTDANGDLDNDVTVLVSDTDFENGWNEAMETTGWTVNAGPDPNEYECSGVENVVVRVTVIEVSFGTP